MWTRILHLDDQKDVWLQEIPLSARHNHREEIKKKGRDVVGGPYILVDQMNTRSYGIHNWCRPIKG